MTLPDVAKPQRTFWQRYKSYTWIAFQCWAVWFVAKGVFVLVYAATGWALTPIARNVIDAAALAPAFAWYVWRYYMPRRTGQLADGAAPGDGAMTIRWGRGLLRLWVVLTVLWIGGAGLIVWQDHTSGRLLTDEEFGIAPPPFDPDAYLAGKTEHEGPVASGPWEDYKPSHSSKHDPYAKLPSPGTDLSSLSDDQLTSMYRQSRVSTAPPKLSPALFGWVFGPPVLLLLLGFTGNWIFRGFKM